MGKPGEMRKRRCTTLPQRLASSFTAGAGRIATEEARPDAAHWQKRFGIAERMGGMFMAARPRSFEKGWGQQIVPTVSGVVPTTPAKLKSGQSIDEVIAEGLDELQGFAR
jgi:hypothetical protein